MGRPPLGNGGPVSDKAISFNGVSESENLMDFRVAEPDGQHRIDNLMLRPSLEIAYPKQKISLIFGRQNQTGTIGLTSLIMKLKFTDCFF